MRYSSSHVLTAVVRGVFLGIPRGEHGYPESRPDPLIVATFDGILRDRHFGAIRRTGAREKLHPYGTEIRNARQVSIVSREDLAMIAERLDIPHVEPEWLGANVVLEGILALTKLPPGTHLAFPNGTALVVDDESEPCATCARAVGRHTGEDGERRFVQAALGYRGVNAWVERQGRIAMNDRVVVRFPKESVGRIERWFPVPVLEAVGA